jgi:hypothetical protein
MFLKSCETFSRSANLPGLFFFLLNNPSYGFGDVRFGSNASFLEINRALNLGIELGLGV